MFDIIIGSSAGLGVGFGISFLINFFFEKQKISQKKRSARHILQQALDSEEQKQEHALSEVEKYKEHLLQKREQDREVLSKAHRVLQTEVDHIRQKKESCEEQLMKQKTLSLQELNQALKTNKEKEVYFKEKQNVLKEKQKHFIQNLKTKFNLNINNLKQEYGKTKIDQAKSYLITQIKEKEEYLKHNVSQQAHFILELALCRFQQAYCPERGIDNVVFASQGRMEYLLGPNFSKVRLLEKECGVDLQISDREPAVSVLGLDPVRRELGRAVLNRVKNKKFIRESDIKGLVRDTKRELFRRIKRDGERICQNLHLRDIKTEVKNMMGALRYRYSFAQNQHFHCQEVGWLCGLLSEELGEPIVPARRAGMLHDIGKAMDHSKEGGHAVIGADFIQEHGEGPEVVQAVRAHHHDVLPEKPLDFLVISADALSGARPGARRSTVDSYNQRMITLEKIGRSFEGVRDTYIMSAGREIRVIVDSQKVNDLKALELSKKIARKIEEECAYPGLIKVTVLRTVTQNSAIPKKRRERSLSI